MKYANDGESIEEQTDTILEFTNADLEVQKEIAKVISEMEGFRIQADFDDYVCSFRKYAIAEMVCIGVPWVFGVTIPLAGLGIAAVGVAACNIIIMPEIDELLEEDCG